MEEIFRLGKHEFATREEWEGAQRDLEKIKSLVDQLDIDDPKDVEHIYHRIREGTITFESKLGTAFFCDISDRAAQNLQNQLEEKEKRWARERKKQRILLKQKEEQQRLTDEKKQKLKETQQSQMFKILGIACAVLSLICILFYANSIYKERKAVRKLEELQQQKSISQAINWYVDRIRNGSQNDSADQTGTLGQGRLDADRPEVLQEYRALYAQYPDFVGWIYIDDTEIDLPVVQTTDNAYYLHNNIDGTEDVNGTLFLDCRDDFWKPSTNLIIYGHNMKSGAMFGGLKQYLEQSYVMGHDMIQFDTIYEKQTYQIIAVCLSEVGYQDDDAYRYYNFIEAGSAEEFNAFLESIRKCAVYDKTQDVTQSDSLLTLSTCNSYVEDGRLFVVAKKIQ